MTMIDKRRILWFSISGLLMPLAAPSAAGAGCPELATELTRTERAAMQGDFVPFDRTRVVVASNQSLRFFNNEVFDNWTQASEFMSQLLHRWFVLNLQRERPESASWLMTMAETPFTKNLQLVFASRGAFSPELSALLMTAKDRAVRDLVEFVYSSQDAQKFELARFKHDRPATHNPLEIKLPDFASADLAKLRLLLHHQFVDPAALTKQLLHNYAVGIGANELDAQFSARVSGNSQIRPNSVIDFSLTRLLLVVEGMQSQRELLGPSFATLTEADLIRLFSTLRRFSTDPADRPSPEVAAVVRELNLQPDGSSLEKSLLQLRRYMRTLGFLDYLPRGWFEHVEGSAEAFSNLGSVDWIIYGDIRGLGAANLLLLHKESKRMLPMLRQAKLLEDQLLRGKDPAPNGLLQEHQKLLSEIEDLREKILQPSNAAIRANVEALTGVLKSQGIPREQMAIWNSGDDIVISVRGARSMEPGEFLSAIVRSPNFSTELRFGVLRLDQSRPLELKDARLMVAEVVSSIKSQEGNSQDATYAHGRIDSSGKVTDLSLVSDLYGTP
jgi:hypothetical protein